MKNFLLTDRKLLFNVLFALFLGVLFGNFLGNRIIHEDTMPVIADGYSDEIFIIQTGIYYDELSANIALAEMKKLGFEPLVVKEHNKYYLYHDIASDHSEFDELVAQFEQQQIDYFIKSKELFTLLTNLNTTETDAEYEFYYQSLEFYLIMLRGRSVTIDDEYIDLVDDSNLMLFNTINALNNSIANEKLAPKYELHIYKNLAEILL